MVFARVSCIIGHGSSGVVVKRSQLVTGGICYVLCDHVQVPLMEVAGPLAVVQLLETSLLCLVNYARFTYFYRLLYL